jgi:hypothetical protein
MTSDRELERLRYQIAWEEHRRRDRLGCIVTAAFVVVPPYAAFRYLLTYTRLVHGPSPLPGVPIFVVTMLGVMFVSLLVGAFAGIAVAELRMRGFRCPRCRQQFQPNRHPRNRCQHCGLPFGAESDPDAG